MDIYYNRTPNEYHRTEGISIRTHENFWGHAVWVVWFFKPQTGSQMGNRVVSNNVRKNEDEYFNRTSHQLLIPSRKKGLTPRENFSEISMQSNCLNVTIWILIITSVCLGVFGFPIFSPVLIIHTHTEPGLRIINLEPNSRCLHAAG